MIDLIGIFKFNPSNVNRIKLKVEFTIADPAIQSSDISNFTSTDPLSISQSVDNIRSRVSRSSNSVSTPRTMDDLPGSPEAILAELQGLRKKYDAVVEYTVHLTAERDYHFAQLEELRREFSKEKSRKKPNEVTPNKKSMDKKEEQQGFSLLVVILVGIISFLIARFMHV